MQKMAKLLQRLSQRLSSADPRTLSTIILVSASTQYFALVYGARYWIEHNFKAAHIAVPVGELVVEDHMVGGPDIARVLTNAMFGLNKDIPLAFAHQMLASLLISTCLARGKPAGWAALCCGIGCVGSVYLAWIPVVRLLALSSLVRDGNATAYKRLSFLMFDIQRRTTTMGQAISLSTAAAMLTAIVYSQPFKYGLPGVVIYLALVLL